jgi:hypothetical protein
MDRKIEIKRLEREIEAELEQYKDSRDRGTLRFVHRDSFTILHDKMVKLELLKGEELNLEVERLIAAQKN